MNSIQIKVPRNLIKEFHQHPEPYGDFVVTLINEMYTDVYYKESGDFITITNDEDLILYLQENQVESREYFYRNGVFAFRNIEHYDKELFDSWRGIRPVNLKLEIDNNYMGPSRFILCVYWVEVGTIEVKDKNINVDVYETKLIDLFANDDISVIKSILEEYIK